jgi:D-aspartate ligase
LITSRHQFDALPESFFEGALLKPLSSVDFASKHGGEGLYREQPPAGQPRNRATRTSHHAAEFVPGSARRRLLPRRFPRSLGAHYRDVRSPSLRMHPGKLGNSTFIESVPLRNLHGAIFPLEYLLEQMSYRGIFSAEFKYHLRDRTFKRIEINARPWWYMEFAAHCGVDVVSMATNPAVLGESFPHLRCGTFGALSQKILRSIFNPNIFLQ